MVESKLNSKQKDLTEFLYETTVNLGDVDLFVPNPWNVNIMTEEQFEELKNSIQITNGKYLKENPIKVRKNSIPDKLEIIDGEHRWLACKELGIKKIPFQVIEIDDSTAKKLNVIYSRNRGQEDYFKLSKLLNEYYETNKITQDQIAEEFGLGDKKRVNNILKIYQRLNKFYEKVSHARLSNRILEELANCRNEYLLERLIDFSIESKRKSEQIRKMASELNAFDEYMESQEPNETIRNEILGDLFEKFGVAFISWDIGSMKSEFNLMQQTISEEKLILGDCLDIIPELEYEFDAIITDPPYNLSSKGYEVKFEDRKNFNTDFGKWDFFDTKEAFIEFSEKWIKIAITKLKEGGVILIFTAIETIESLIKILENNGLQYHTTISWHKTNPKPSPGIQYANAMEYIIYASKGNCSTFNLRGKNPFHNFIESAICMGNERKLTKHTTQKPIEVIEELVLTHTNPNNYILDPFAGSGTTAVACMKQKRNFVIIEKDDNYYQTAKIRIREAKKGDVEI